MCRHRSGGECCSVTCNSTTPSTERCADDNGDDDGAEGARTRFGAGSEPVRTLRLNDLCDNILTGIRTGHLSLSLSLCGSERARNRCVCAVADDGNADSGGDLIVLPSHRMQCCSTTVAVSIERYSTPKERSIFRFMLRHCDSPNCAAHSSHCCASACVIACVFVCCVFVCAKCTFADASIVRRVGGILIKNA